MKIRAFGALAVALCLSGPAVHAAPVIQGPPARALTDPASVVSPPGAASPAPVADLFYTRGVADAAWTRDGRALVVSTNLTGRYNLWLVPIEGGFPLQLTQSDDRQGGLQVSPDGRWALFDSDHAGDEIYDLKRVSLADGTVEDLTATADITETGGRWSPDGRTIAFDRRLKTAPSTDVAVLDVATRAVRLLTHEAAPDRAWSVRGFTADGRRILADRADFTGQHSEAFLIDAATGERTPLTAPGIAYIQAVAITPDSRQAAVTYETAEGAKRAGLLDIAAHALKPASYDPWEQAATGLSPGGRTLLFTRNVDGRVALCAFGLADGTVRTLGPGDGVDRAASDAGEAVSPDGTRVALVHEGGSTPPDIWVAPLAGR